MRVIGVVFGGSNPTMDFYAPQQASAAMNRIRDLVRDGAMPLAYAAIFDYLTFRARLHGRDRVHVSYSTMARNLHTSRRKLVEAVRAFEAAGLLRKIRHRVRVAWQGIMASRQGTNEYVFCRVLPPAAEFRPGPTIREGSKKKAQRAGPAALTPVPRTVGNCLEAALAELGRTIGLAEPRTEER